MFIILCSSNNTENMVLLEDMPYFTHIKSSQHFEYLSDIEAHLVNESFRRKYVPNAFMINSKVLLDLHLTVCLYEYGWNKVYEILRSSGRLVAYGDT